MQDQVVFAPLVHYGSDLGDDAQIGEDLLHHVFALILLLVESVALQSDARLRSPENLAPPPHLWHPATQPPLLAAKEIPGGIRYRQKPQAPTPQAPVRNRQTRKVANAKVRIG